MRIGLAGGIGSGKSEVAARLSELGADVIEADAVARELVAPGTPLLEKLVGEFGDGILRPDGSLDRRALAGIAFASDEALGALNESTRPPLVAEIVRRSEALERERPGGIMVVDAALLVQWGVLDMFDVVLVVRAPEDVRVARLTAAGLSEDDARARMRSQLGDEEMSAAADVVMDNDGTLEDLLRAVDAFWETLAEKREEGRQ